MKKRFYASNEQYCALTDLAFEQIDHSLKLTHVSGSYTIDARSVGRLEGVLLALITLAEGGIIDDEDSVAEPDAD